MFNSSGQVKHTYAHFFTNVLTWVVWSMWTTDASLRLQWWEIVPIIHGSSRNWNSGAQYTKSDNSWSTFFFFLKGVWGLAKQGWEKKNWGASTLCVFGLLWGLFFSHNFVFLNFLLSSTCDMHNNFSFLWKCEGVVQNHCVWHWTPWLLGPSSSSS